MKCNKCGIEYGQALHILPCTSTLGHGTFQAKNGGWEVEIVPNDDGAISSSAPPDDASFSDKIKSKAKKAWARTRELIGI